MNATSQTNTRPTTTLLRLAGAVRESYVDGPGIRFALFTQGCPHNCHGCHNPETHDFNGGYETTAEHIAAEIIKTPGSGITFSGGEPFCQAEALAEVIRLVRAKKKASLIVYTGYRAEQLITLAKTDCGVKALLTEANYIIDGRYEEGLRDLTLRFRGSSNQRIMDFHCYPNSENVYEIDNF